MPDTLDLNTTYFPLAVVQYGVSGCCHDVAYAITRRMGWGIGVVWEDRILDAFTIDPRPTPTHLVAIAPNGLLVDVEGARTEAEVLAYYRAHAYGRSVRLARYPDETSAAAALLAEGAFGDMLQPRDHRIAAAEQTLWQSAPFLALLKGLAVSPAVAEPG